tara:strand:+ start:711 stop:878 length:168 start_codon:yes stop_codon:yes gene_type:complete
MGFGSIYAVTYFGEVNASNGWGQIYPPDADGSTFTADTIDVLADTTDFKADATQY